MGAIKNWLIDTTYEVLKQLKLDNDQFDIVQKIILDGSDINVKTNISTISEIVFDIIRKNSI